MGKFKDILQRDEVPTVIGMGMLASVMFGAVFTFVPMNEPAESKQSEAATVLYQAFYSASQVLLQESREFSVVPDQAAQNTLSSLRDISGVAETEDERIARFNAFAAKRDQLLDLLATDKFVSESRKDHILQSLQEADIIPSDHPAYKADADYLQECQASYTDPDGVLQCTTQMADEFDDGRLERGTPFGVAFLLLAMMGIGRSVIKPKAAPKPRYRH